MDAALGAQIFAARMRDKASSDKPSARNRGGRRQALPDAQSLLAATRDARKDAIHERNHLGDDPEKAAKARAYLLQLFDGDESFGLQAQHYKDTTRKPLGFDLSIKASAAEKRREDDRLMRPTSAPSAGGGALSRTHS
eukprot:6804335-Prymnesium_polylepis.1